MFGFLKKLFGGDAETNKAAGVQIEQVPYKVESPTIVAVSHSDVVVLENKADSVNRQPIEKPAKAESKSVSSVKPKKSTAKKSAAKSHSEPKPAAKKPAAKRKPKSTT